MLFAKDANSSRPFNYTFSICSNDVTPCQSTPSEQIMVTERNINNGNCFNVARFDKSIQPVYTNVIGGLWTFRYDNGDSNLCNSSRTWIPTFICEQGVKHKMGPVNEDPRSCVYKVEIQTQYACVD